MKTLYLDCPMGAAGDMLCAALLGLYEDKDGFIETMNTVLEGMAHMAWSKDMKCGISGIHVSVSVDGHREDEHMHDHHHHGHHHHVGIAEVLRLIEGCKLPEKVRQDAANVFRLIAEAEAHAHDREMEHIHFHELGTADALADVLSVCLLMYLLAPDKILASPINVGGGTVKCAHGVLPVPAPATEYILRGVPVYSGEIKTELCTPTGAALLKYFAEDFVAMPGLRISDSAYGTGTKDFQQLNAVRAILGESEGERQQILELRCNIDDMSGEELGFAMEELLSAGALDVFFTPIYMKKCRPGTMLSVLCKVEMRQDIVNCIFKNTRTLGIRETLCPRHVLRREFRRVDTDMGPVTVKRAVGYGVEREKIEYEDMAAIARGAGKSLLEIKQDLNNN